MPDPRSAPDDSGAASTAGGPGRPRGPDRPLWRVGRTAWALVGIAAVLAVAGYVLSALTLVVIPVVLALFPATLLAPVSDLLRRRGLPPALAALVTLLGAITLLLGVLAGVVALVIAQLPALLDSAAQGVAQLEQLLADDPLGLGIEGLADVLELGREQLGEAGELAAQATAAAFVAFEVVAALLLLLVVLFFYLKDGRRLRDALVSSSPARHRAFVRASLDRSWTTLAGYMRGQLLVALVDAVAIGIGLLIVGVPLALPLAVLVLFGGLFPIIGAVATGTLAVLVALADGGLVAGLIVLGIVVGVQQLEGNVLEPLILGRVIQLHPLVVLLAVTTGAVTYGILGAFLGVPLAAIVARIIDLRHDHRASEVPA